MRPFLADTFGNPASAHAFGREAAAAIDQARGSVAALIGARPNDIVFTSGGTEANNAALKGVALAARDRGCHVVTSAVEHDSVLEPAVFLQTLGFEVTRLPVDGQGRIDPDDARAAIRADTVLVSILHGNNEIGTLQPLAEVARFARSRRVPFHTDAVQTTGHIEVDVDRLGVDLLSLSGHKLHGPKGVGALYVRAGTPLVPLLHGGGHEQGRRSSTLNVPGIVGLGKAAELARRRLRSDADAIEALRARLLEGITARVRDACPNGHPSERLPGILSVSFRGADAVLLARELDRLGIACATGSACHGPKAGPSHVLVALGLPDDLRRGTLRFSIGRGVDAADVDRVIEVLPRAVRAARGAAEFLG